MAFGGFGIGLVGPGGLAWRMAHGVGPLNWIYHRKKKSEDLGKGVMGNLDWRAGGEKVAGNGPP